jgi:prepilin-type N-terminal cleavage/methylation domain-containing protein
MSMQKTNSGSDFSQPDFSQRGFSLLELMISMALGLIVMAAMAGIFKTGMNSTMLVTQRAETQQNMRAALDLIAKDISMAGAGVPTGGIQLPTGGPASLSKLACDQTSACHVPTSTYPTTPTWNYLYGIIPGYLNGVEANAVIPAAPAPAVNDSITVAYADYNFPLWEYNASFVAGSNGSQMTLAPNPKYTPAPPPINGAGAIQAGDLIMVSGGSLTAVAEVTNITATTMTFANLDPLNINQGAATSGNTAALAGVVGVANVSVYRLFVVTYYLSVPPAGQTPRLMRQVNGLTPVPVADDIINLQFAYDVYNSSNNALDANQTNPLGVAESPNNIQKVNVVVMGQSIITNGNKAQNMSLGTSVSARNMAFRNRYQ